MIRKAIVLAAGRGTRLGIQEPKPLCKVGGVPMLCRGLDALYQAGIDEAVVVVGFQADLIQAALDERSRVAKGPRIWIAVNRDYELPNGLSVLAARAHLTERVLLLMSDHVFDPSMIDLLVHEDRRDDETVLGLDFHPDRVFDLPDATKVLTNGERVVDIGKELGVYDAIDTGFFCISPALAEELTSLREQHGGPGPSLSDGVRSLARRGLVRGVTVGDRSWIDVDTPEARAVAEHLATKGAFVQRRDFTLVRRSTV